MLDHVGNPGRLRRRRPTHPQTRISPLDGPGGVIVELKIGRLFRLSSPKVDIRLIPDFEIPLRDFVHAVAIDQMFREVINQRLPFRIILRRRRKGMIPERVRGQRCSQRARHEAHLDEGPHAVVQQSIINLIDVGPVVDRLSLRVFRINPHVVVEDRMKANVANVGGRFHGPKLAPVAFAERQNCAARTEHLFPVMWKRARCRPAHRPSLPP